MLCTAVTIVPKVNEKMKRKAHSHCCRLLWLMLILLWAGVTITAFGFHHHAEGDACEDICCPFALVVLNFPFLVIVFLFLFPPETPPFRRASASVTPGIRLIGIASVRGPPESSFA